MAKTLSTKEMIEKGFPCIEYEKGGVKQKMVFTFAFACSSATKLLENQGYKVRRIQ